MKYIERPIANYIIEKWNNMGDISLPDMLVSLVEIRRHIETFHNKDREFGVAKFYCDWALHNYIDNNYLAQNALNIINRNFRSPIKHIEEPNDFSQTIVKALSYHNVGHQIGTIICEITNNFFSVDNKFMRMLLTCLIGIPLIQKQTKEAEQIEVKINQDCKKAFEKYQQHIDYNTITGILSNNRICNFTILRIIDNHMDFSIDLDNGETILAFVEFGTL